MAYTPGQWRVSMLPTYDGLTGDRCRNVFAGMGGLTILVARCLSEDRDDNAALIAAAPRLLEALRAIVDQWEQAGDVSVTKFAEGRAAIAQATGDWGD